MVFALTQLVFAYRVGTGVADVTGLCGNIQMMGYADMNQQATGIHMRLKSRGLPLRSCLSIRLNSF